LKLIFESQERKEESLALTREFFIFERRCQPIITRER
jgi:hypothetical protein